MAVQIIPLSCPKCGNASNVPEKELRFGYMFTCPYCSTTSVLIIDRQLYVPQAGEHVCTTCGRVAPPGARFCQCGQSLVRKCTNCLEEFPIDHNLCDYCGWPQDIDPLSEAAVSMQVQRAIRHLSDPDAKVRLNAIQALGRIGPAASAAVPAMVEEYLKVAEALTKIDICIALGEIGPAAVPALVEVLKSSEDEYTKYSACVALGKIGPAASAAVPAMVEVLKSSEDENTKYNACVSLGEIGAAAVPALVEVLKSSKDVHKKVDACKALGEIGPAASAAVPALKSLARSWFVSSAVKYAAEVAIAQIKG